MAKRGSYEFKKEQQEKKLVAAEYKLRGNILGATIFGGLTLAELIGLAILIAIPGVSLGITGPLACVVAATTMATVGLTKTAIESTETAVDVQRSIVESVENKKEATEMQNSARKELAVEEKKFTAGGIIAGASFLAPVISAALGVNSIDKKAGLVTAILGLTVLGISTGANIMANSDSHQKVLQLKRNSWAYTKISN